MEDLSKTITVKEYAELKGIALDTVYKQIKRDAVKHTIIFGKKVILLD